MKIFENKLNSIENDLNSDEFHKDVLEKDEIEHNAKDLCDFKTAEMEKLADEFERTATLEFQDICRKYNVSEELKLKYKNKLQEICDVASTLARFSKRRMTQVVIGASMFISTAQAVEASDMINNTEKVKGVVNVAMFENTDRDQDLRERTEQMAEYIRNQEIKWVGSDEYFEKLKIEFKGDEVLAKKNWQQRIDNLKSVNIIFHNTVEDVAVAHGEGLAGDKPVAGFYRESDHEIHVFRQYTSLWSTLRHELNHASLRGSQDITESAKEILNDTYKTQGFLGVFSDVNDKYLGNSSERIVRKQEFEKELIGRGIKKYGEEFTEEGYKRMMLLYENGKLSEEENDFIKRTKPGYENFKKIFENIAKNEVASDSVNV
jgi:hypothetical protein